MPRQLVIDANITLAWLFDEAGSAAAIGPILGAASLVAPALWRLEIANVLLVRERRKMLAASRTSELLELLDDWNVEVVADATGSDLKALIELARPNQLTAYDAVYLDLAMRRSIPLFTRDRNLLAAASHVAVSLVSEPTP